jgi:hypothetical protein
MSVKVRGGTVNHGAPPLCTSCRYAVVARGARVGEEIVKCSALGNLRFEVTSCSAYENRATPSLWQMEQIAWVLRPNSGTKSVGFVEASTLSDEERHVLEE